MGAIGGCCCCITREELPNQITSSGALNVINRADWVLSSECCFRSTFNFNNAWTRSISGNTATASRYSVRVSSGYIRPPVFLPSGSTCADITVSTPVKLVDQTDTINDDREQRLFVEWRLKAIHNFVSRAADGCANPYIWFSIYEIEYRSAQTTTSRYVTSCTPTVYNSCWTAAGSTVTTEVTEAMVWAGSGSWPTSVFEFWGYRSFSSLLTLSGSETFAPSDAPCTGAGCIQQRTPLITSVTVNSSSFTYSLTALDGTIPSLTATQSRSLNILPGTFGGLPLSTYGPFAAVNSLIPIANSSCQFTSFCITAPASMICLASPAGNPTSPPCFDTFYEACGVFATVLRPYFTPSHRQVDSATAPAPTLSSYTAQSITINCPNWVITFV